MRPSKPETFIRVKLPWSSGYASCPSGDTDFEVDYNKAIAAKLPEGWEVVKQWSNYRAPVDSDGLTLLQVRKRSTS